jgi:hypothetical protein
MHSHGYQHVLKILEKLSQRPRDLGGISSPADFRARECREFLSKVIGGALVASDFQMFMS